MWGLSPKARCLQVISAQPCWPVSWRSHRHSSDTRPTHKHLHCVIGMYPSTWGCGREGLWPLVIHLARDSPPGTLLELISPPERQFIFTWAQSHANTALQLSKWSWLGAGMCQASVEHRGARPCRCTLSHSWKVWFLWRLYRHIHICKGIF